MSERLPDPNTLTRQPGQPSTGGDAPHEDEITPEQAVEEARRGRETAERSAAQERERASAAARERDEAQRQAADAGSQAWTAQERAIGQSIQAQTALAEQARQSIATAQAAGDHVAVADAFDRLAEARAALRDLANQKTYFDNLKTQRQQSPPQQQQPSNHVTVSTPGGQMPVSPGAKQWMDEHPRFYSDGAYYNHAVAAHGTIVADGIQPESTAYFRALNDRMQQFERFEAFERGDSQPQGEPMRQQQPSQRRASSMAAPVSRTTAAAANSRSTTSGPIDPMMIAQRLGPTVTEADLREFARINGYTKTLTDDAGFQRYLKEQDDIFRIDQAGGETGIKYDSVYR